jgi:hypothetical protein
MVDTLPTLPDDIIRIIIKDAKLDIDTRKALRVKPGRLTEDPAYDTVRERLKAMHTRRLEKWRSSEAARKQDEFAGLEAVKIPGIRIGPLRQMFITLEVWDVDGDGDVRMSIEAYEVFEDDPENPFAILRRSTYSIVSTGEECPMFFDDDSSDDDDDDDDFDDFDDVDDLMIFVD